ncbi:MAG TPA: hypothetical protein VF843_09485 [Streptosporangiaceae bacterium]
MAVRRARKAGIAAVVVIVVIVAFLAFFKAKHLRFPAPAVSGCVVHGHRFDIPLEASQAGIAATIAGVAAQHQLPVRAVTIAYATALQESDLANLNYGDRDSVGVFQQRPSQGWGSRHQLLDPVYASTKFFAALAAIPRYQHLRVYKAAQDVQRSADGSAYAQYTTQSAQMAGGFSGHRARAVWCWYSAPIKGKGQLSAAAAQLRHAYGFVAISHSGDPTARVVVHNAQLGWSMAAWLVTHASKFRIRDVTYEGYRWTSAHGHAGWRPDRGRRGAVTEGSGLEFG